MPVAKVLTTLSHRTSVPFCRSELATFIQQRPRPSLAYWASGPRELTVDLEWKGLSRSHCLLSFLWYSYVESDVLTSRLRIGQRTRSRAIHISARSRTCSLRWWVVEGAVAKCSVRVVTGLWFWLLLSNFPTGKDYFPPILLWLAPVYT